MHNPLEWIDPLGLNKYFAPGHVMRPPENGVIIHYMAKIDKDGNMIKVTDFKIKYPSL